MPELIAWVVAFAAAGAPAPGFNPNCNDPQSNLEMKLCTEQEWKRADADMNEAYAKAIASAREQNRSARDMPGYEKMPDSEAMLRKAQRAWVAFRDTNCAYQYQLYYGGSHAGLAYLICKADITKARAAELKQLLNGLEDPEPQQ